ncbi:MAG TPA: hypothetical protein VFX13_13085 [Gaiellales bacterium]|nr:hypothetical protein [Gaiellales bacterium]
MTLVALLGIAAVLVGAQAVTMILVLSLRFGGGGGPHYALGNGAMAALILRRRRSIRPEPVEIPLAG